MLFQAIQFSITTQFISIWPIDWTQSSAPTRGQSGHWWDRNEGVLGIPKSSCITGTPPSDCLVSYTGHSLMVCYSLQRCSWCIQQPQPSRPNKFSETRYVRRWSVCGHTTAVFLGFIFPDMQGTIFFSCHLSFSPHDFLEPKLYSCTKTATAWKNISETIKGIKINI